MLACSEFKKRYYFQEMTTTIAVNDTNLRKFKKDNREKIRLEQDSKPRSAIPV